MYLQQLRFQKVTSTLQIQILQVSSQMLDYI